MLCSSVTAKCNAGQKKPISRTSIQPILVINPVAPQLPYITPIEINIKNTIGK